MISSFTTRPVDLVRFELTPQGLKGPRTNHCARDPCVSHNCESSWCLEGESNSQNLVSRTSTVTNYVTEAFWRIGWDSNPRCFNTWLRARAHRRSGHQSIVVVLDDFEGLEPSASRFTVWALPNCAKNRWSVWAGSNRRPCASKAPTLPD